MKGQLLDDDNQPIVSAVVVLMKESVLLNGISNAEGYFIIQNIPLDKYILKISHLGFQQYEKEITINHDLDIGEIVLENSSELLNEVVITAKTIESFADRKIYRLTETDRKSSTSALDAMKVIPKILVGIGDKLITVRGDEVKILINGINGLESDLATLSPDDILRIEHYENPPARFANLGLGAVINVITKKKNNGGTIGLNLQNALTTGFGNDLFNINYNHNNTQVGFKYSLNYRDFTKRVLDESLNYKFKGVDFDKEKKGVNGPYDYQIHQFELSFINMKENDYVFSTNVSLNMFDQDKGNKQNITRSMPTTDEYMGNSFEKNKHLKPAIDLYFNKQINSGQDFTVNVVGSYFDTQMKNRYHEYRSDYDTIFYNYTKVNGNKYSLISDLIYSYTFSKNKLSFGVRDIYSYSKQILTTKNEEEISSKLNELFSYVELTGDISKFNYALSIGGNYNYFDSYDLDKKYTNFYFRPAINIKYMLNNQSDLLINYLINTTNPSISALSYNPVMQDINIAYSGNPNLKPFSTHSLLLSYSLYKDYFTFISDVSFDYSKNPILPFFADHPDYILQTFENLSNSKRYNLSLFAQWFPFKSKWLRLRTFAEFFRNEVKYNGISWEHNDLRIIPSIMLHYKKWDMNLFYQSKTKILDGQLLRHTPSAAFVELSYKPIPQMSTLIGLRYPFYSAWKNSAETHGSAPLYRFTTESIKDNANMVYIQFVYNFSFGKQFKSSKKKLNNIDKDSGILQQ
jgi:hypothetical protein